jgi:hypothetical protein
MLTRIFLAGLALALAAPCTAGVVDAPTPFHVGQTMREFHPDVPRNWRGARLHGLRTTIWFPVDAAVPEQPHDIGPPGTPLISGSATGGRCDTV